ncbi:DUF952 domain-containing protein [Deinococcus sp.]|uniref:DUF952 domain-containing protein n=1 Tax=Deinococcus sp. TaxID=47478 RepID=UPI003C7EA57D
MLIAHITSTSAWNAAQTTGSYTAASLQTEGFIHCSEFNTEQLLAVANFLYVGQPKLMVLLIESDHLTSELRFEEFETSGKFFPHIYGPLNLEAVVEVLPFPPQSDGTFRLPDLHSPA